MKVRIILTTESGEVFEGAASLSRIAVSGPAGVPGKTQASRAIFDTLAFNLNPRAFMNRYGHNGSGPQKFTFLLARLTKGKSGVVIPFETLKSTWNSMTGVLGSFNNAYSLRAKENGWVDTPRYGS